MIFFWGEGTEISIVDMQKTEREEVREFLYRVSSLDLSEPLSPAFQKILATGFYFNIMIINFASPRNLEYASLSTHPGFVSSLCFGDITVGVKFSSQTTSSPSLSSNESSPASLSPTKNLKPPILIETTASLSDLDSELAYSAHEFDRVIITKQTKCGFCQKKVPFGFRFSILFLGISDFRIRYYFSKFASLVFELFCRFGWRKRRSAWNVYWYVTKNAWRNAKRVPNVGWQTPKTVLAITVSKSPRRPSRLTPKLLQLRLIMGWESRHRIRDWWR